MFKLKQPYRLVITILNTGMSFHMDMFISKMNIYEQHLRFAKGKVVIFFIGPINLVHVILSNF